MEEKRLLHVDRKKFILEQIRRSGSVSVSRLSEQLEVSEETIRRDLQTMENESLLTRVHGGAYINYNVNSEVPITLRRDVYKEGKLAIGQLCATMVEDGETIFLDASSTALRVATSLKGNKTITVITNSFDIVTLFADDPAIAVICCGGKLDKGSLSFRSYATINTLEHFYADKAFVSCTGLSLQNGATDGDELQACIRKKMFEHANKHILIVDSTKFDKTTMHKIIDLNQIKNIVTDKKPLTHWLDEFSRQNITCEHTEI